MTVSSKTIKYLADLLQFFSSEFKGTNVLIGKVSKIGRAEDHEIDSIENYDDICLKNLVEKYKDKLSFAMQKKKKVHDVHTCYCGAAQARHFIISKSGLIRTCAHFDEFNEFTIGSIIDGQIVLDNEKIERLQCAHNVSNQEECKECIAKYYCAGGCPSNKKYSYDDYFAACKIQKSTFLDKIEIEMQKPLL